MRQVMTSSKILIHLLTLPSIIWKRIKILLSFVPTVTNSQHRFTFHYVRLKPYINTMTEPTCQGLTDHASAQLVEILFKRGYFHDPKPTFDDNLEKDDSLEVFLAMKEGETQIFSESDEACHLVSTTDNHYLTLSQLRHEMGEEIGVCGRLSLNDAAEKFAVPLFQIERVSSYLLDQNNKLHLVGTDLITSEHFDSLAKQVETQLNSGDGHLSVSEVASTIYDMTVDVVLKELTGRLDGKPINAELSVIGGTKVLVSPRYEKNRSLIIQSIFSALDLPTLVETLCQDKGWDSLFVLPLLRELCKNGKVPGELHESSESSSSAGSMFVPHVYEKLQRKNVDEFFSANGWITAEKCLAIGIPKGRMGEFVKESFSSAVVLSACVISNDMIVPALQLAVQEVIAAEYFLDLKLTLPEDLVSNENDISRIMNDLVMPGLAEEGEMHPKNHGKYLITDGEALFFSTEMIGNIEKSIVTPLVESYGKSRAKEIDAIEIAASEKSAVYFDDIEDRSKISGKEKRKNRKASKEKKNSMKSGESLSFGVVPLVSVVHRVADQYPDLADIQESYGPIMEPTEEKPPLWDETETGGPIFEFCRVAFYNRKFEDKCAKAVKAELDRIKSARNASVSSRKDGATRVRNIETSFEGPTCFPAACYQIQMLSKFIRHISSFESSDNAVASLKNDFLVGCANFTRRITEFALWSNQLEGISFLFDRDVSLTPCIEEAEYADLPYYCRPVNYSIRHFRPVYLSCKPGKDGERRDPLKALRELLPGNVGVAVAKMWSLCGGEFYEGGRRPGDFDKFLEHAEETCIIICGLPFKKLDKKSEKQALFSRRKELTDALEKTEEPKAVLDLTIMLLYQQVKSVVAVGNLLAGPVLDALGKEKKMPEAVTELLREVASDIEENNKILESTVLSVKSCGLSRDISKHQIK